MPRLSPGRARPDRTFRGDVVPNLHPLDSLIGAQTRRRIEECATPETLHKIINPITQAPCFVADNNVKYQGVDIIAQTDGTILLAATRPGAIDLFEFVATSEDIQDVQANLVAEIDGFYAKHTDAFKYGGNVMVWQEHDGPSIRVMCIESWDRDSFLWKYSYFELWSRVGGL